MISRIGFDRALTSMAQTPTTTTVDIGNPSEGVGEGEGWEEAMMIGEEVCFGMGSERRGYLGSSPERFLLLLLDFLVLGALVLLHLGLARDWWSVQVGRMWRVMDKVIVEHVAVCSHLIMGNGRLEQRTVLQCPFMSG